MRLTDCVYVYACVWGCLGLGGSLIKTTCTSHNVLVIGAMSVVVYLQRVVQQTQFVPISFSPSLSLALAVSFCLISNHTLMHWHLIECSNCFIDAFWQLIQLPWRTIRRIRYMCIWFVRLGRVYFWAGLTAIRDGFCLFIIFVSFLFLSHLEFVKWNTQNKQFKACFVGVATAKRTAIKISSRWRCAA